MKIFFLKEATVQNFRYLFLLFIAFSFTINAQKKFVGVKTCGVCHKKTKQGEQLKIWQNSAHANAFKTLQTTEADKIATEKGFKTKAVETPECLKCHTTGYGKKTSLFNKKFKVENGVQCETCHGAGSKYKSKKIMKDHDKSVAAGMTEYTNKAAIEKQCRFCHNEDSPTFKEFNFMERWEKIEHQVPKKK